MLSQINLLYVDWPSVRISEVHISAEYCGINRSIRPPPVILEVGFHYILVFNGLGSIIMDAVVNAGDRACSIFNNNARI